MAGDIKTKFRETDTHIYFHGSPLSNWYIGMPFYFHLPVMINDDKGRRLAKAKDPVVLNCGEMGMMGGKGSIFGDFATVKLILAAEKPSQHKSLGRDVKPFHDPTWIAASQTLVTMISIARGAQDDTVYDFVMRSGDKRLVEGSPSDTIWGVGIGYWDRRIENSQNWLGENRLGNAWEDARLILREHGRTVDPWAAMSELVRTRKASAAPSP
jgi:ribA/ribD-fused uncharacterized protein